MYSSTELHKCFNNFTFEAFTQVLSNETELTQKVRNMRSEQGNDFTQKTLTPFDSPCLKWSEVLVLKLR